MSSTLDNCNLFLIDRLLTLDLGEFGLGCLLILLRLSFLVGDLGCDEGVLSLPTKLNIDHLKTYTISVQLLKRIIDGNSEQFGVFFSFVPEGILLPSTDGLTHRKINLLNEVTLIVRLQEVV